MEEILKSIIEKLTLEKLTIATMESCTGGMLVSEITNISGASEVLKESYVTYCNKAKIKQGVSKNTIDTYTVYSKQVAREMAQNVAKNANSNIGIGITGQLDTINKENLKNEIFFAICYNEEVTDYKVIITKEMKRKNKKKVIVNRVIEELGLLLNIFGEGKQKWE